MPPCAMLGGLSFVLHKKEGMFMSTHRCWSSYVFLVTVMVLTSCTQRQIDQVLQNKTQDIISGACPAENGPVSAAPEFCLYVTEMRIANRETEADVSAILLNRTNKTVHLSLSNA